MKNLILIFSASITFITYSQSYTYKPAETPVYNPSPLVDKYNTTPQNSTPSSTIVPPKVSTNKVENNHSISITNVWREAKNIDLYIWNQSKSEWQYLRSERIPDGQTFVLNIGISESCYNYGYIVSGSLITTVTSFKTSSINIF